MSVSAPYYGDSAVMRTPPPDLPSLLLKERIVYLGLPLFSDDDTKRQVGIDVTELIIAQLLYLEFDNPEKPIFFYINSTGTSWYSGDAIGFETEAFAIADTIRYVKPPVHTICIGQAMGTAAMILSAGTKEVLHNKQTMLEMLSANTGRSVEQLSKDSDRMTYLTADQAVEYGLIDRVLTSQKLPSPLPVGAGVSPGNPGIS